MCIRDSCCSISDCARPVSSSRNTALNWCLTSGAPATFITVFARGLVKHQFSAVFLEDDTGLAQSEILQQVPAERRATLIARKSAPGVYHWDIWMQSDKETAFFDYV